jgi:protein-disulfide isomerase
MKKWDVALTAILVICALVTTGLVVRREFFTPASASPIAASKPVFIDTWRSHLDDGVTLGDPDAPVRLIEFADFECPFCARFHNTVRAVQERYPGKIAVSFVHFPLPGHRFAQPAARVAECAGEQGHFEAMHDRLFAQQNAFGLKAWTEFANEAGVTDLHAFETCIRRDVPLQRVQKGLKAGDELDVKGTPTVIINGWKLNQPPDEKQLALMVQAILDGESPVS